MYNYKVLLLLLAVLFFLNGCSTTGFLGLAKESYAKQLEEENRQLKEELEIIKSDMNMVLELAENIEDLENLTKEIESKLDNLPEDTLRKLVSILQDYLEKKESTGE
jgi:PBP1b-binding outer membrane lipoprotein LpoB